MGMVVVAEVLDLDQEAIRRENQKLITTRAPFEGETRTGGERTRFLPRASTNLYKPHPVPQGWSRTKDTYSDSSQPRTIQSRSPYEVPSEVERHHRRPGHSSGYKRCQTTNDIQTSSQTPYQSRAVCKEGRTSYRCGYKGSSHSGFSACFTRKLYYSLGVVTPGGSEPSGRAGKSVHFPRLHSPKAGKRDRIRKAFHSKPQSKWFLYCSRAEIR